VFFNLHEGGTFSSWPEVADQEAKAEHINEIANFHRPEAKWYPHENKPAAELQGAVCSHGSMTVIVMMLAGERVKLLINAEETPSVKSKASKKLEF